MRGWVVAVEGFSVAAKTRLRSLLVAGGAEYAYSISPKVRALIDAHKHLYRGQLVTLNTALWILVPVF